MKKNKRWLIAILAAVLLLLAGNTALYTQLQLKEPVFVENYCELMIEEPETADGEEGQDDALVYRFSLDYFTNPNDSRQVISIRLAGLDQIGISEVFYADSNPDKTTNAILFPDTVRKPAQMDFYASYQRKTVSFLGERATQPGKKNQRSVTVTQGIVEYNDGSQQAVDLGKFIFFLEDTQQEQNLVLSGKQQSGSIDESRFAGSSLQGTTASVFSLNGFWFPFQEEWGKQVEFRLNGNMAQLPKTFCPGDNFQVDCQIDLEECKMVNLQFSLYAEVSKTEGQDPFRIPVGGFYHRAEFSAWSIFGYLKARGAIL